MKSKIVLFTFLFFTTVVNAFGEDLKEKEQLVFRKSLDSYIKENNSNLKYLLNKNPDEIVGLEVVIAVGTDGGAIYSKWGHALLRFVDNDGIWSNDITLNFVALVNTPKLSLVKGVAGGYAILPEVKTLYDFWIQYVQAEDRPLERYIIPTNPKLIKNLLATLKRWSENPSEMGNYKFVGNNCVGVLSKLLSASGIIPSANKAIVPTNFGGKLDELLLSPFEKLVVKSPFYILLKASNLLTLSPNDLLMGTNWPEDASRKLIANFNNDELMFLYQTIPLLPSDVSSVILKQYKENKSSKSFKSFLGFAPVPEALYQLCVDKSCTNQVIEAESKLWGSVVSQSRRSKRIINLYQSTPNLLFTKNEQVASYENLVEAQVELGDYTKLCEEEIYDVSKESKIEIELKYRNGNFDIEVYSHGENFEVDKNSNPENILSARLNQGVFNIQNSDEVTFKGKVVGKLIKKVIGRDIVKFNSPYGLVYKIEDGKQMSVGMLAPTL